MKWTWYAPIGGGFFFIGGQCFCFYQDDLLLGNIFGGLLCSSCFDVCPRPGGILALVTIFLPFMLIALVVGIVALVDENDFGGSPVTAFVPSIVLLSVSLSNWNKKMFEKTEIRL